MQLDFNAIFKEWNDSTQKIFKHDRTQTVGASEVFACLRQVFFKKRGHEFGFEKDPGAGNSWGAARRGDLLENHYIVPALSQFLPTGKMLFAGEDQMTLFKKRNSATPDGLIINLDADALACYGVTDIEGDCVVIEMKTIDPRVGLAEEKAIHHGQAQIQMGIIRDTTQYKPMYAVVLYVDASFLDNIKPFIIRFDQAKWDAAQVRANTIWEHNDPSSIRPEGKFDGSCDLCDFKRACAFVSTGILPPEEKKYKYSDDSKERVGELITKIKKLEGTRNENDKEIEELKFEIKEILRKEKTRKMSEDDRSWAVSWYPQEGKTTIDTKAMEEDGIDLEAYKKKGNPFEVLRITLSK